MFEAERGRWQTRANSEVQLAAKTIDNTFVMQFFLSSSKTKIPEKKFTGLLRF